jgi:hypothetical protein
VDRRLIGRAADKLSESLVTNARVRGVRAASWREPVPSARVE